MISGLKGKKTHFKDKTEIRYILAKDTCNALVDHAKEWINGPMSRHISIKHPMTGEKVNVPILAQVYDVSSAPEAYSLYLSIKKQAEEKGIPVFVANGVFSERKAQILINFRKKLQMQVEKYYK